MPSTKSNVNSQGEPPVMTSSPVRKKTNAAANSRKPMTTLTVLSHDPLLGNFRKSVGKIARKKNGAAKVTENAKPPSRLCHSGLAWVAEVPPNPPRNGATQAK